MRWEFQRPFVNAKEHLIPAVVDFFEDIRLALKEIFVQFPREIKYFIQNLWAYKGLIWTDRDWDHAFILTMLQFKIRRTKEHMAEHKHHTRWKLDVKNMQKAEDMIEGILNNNHGEELREAHEKKWGAVTLASVPVPGNTGSYLRSLRPNIHNPLQQLEHDKEYRIMMKKEMKLEQQAWSKLWKFLDIHMRSWWC